MPIPKKLHFTFATDQLPERYQRNLEVWRSVCPEWEICFYTDKDVYALFEEHFPEYFDVLPKIPYGAMLADFFRYAVLYIQGGLYSDIDTTPLKPIPEEWLAFDGVIGYEYQPSKFPGSYRFPWKDKELLCQWTLLSKPGYFLFKEALEEAFRRLEKFDFQAMSITDVLYTSGPLLLTDIALPYQKRKELLTLDADFFGCREDENLPFTKRSVIAHQRDGKDRWMVQVKLPHLNLR
ncbi:glycosyltransferase family 32 protein [Simkania sp.]|uniref:glycosyltransferase family 32 protein n=1 Tax=Simkania sp. TaxID=34094 RepID=UPI003B527218